MDQHNQSARPAGNAVKAAQNEQHVTAQGLASHRPPGIDLNCPRFATPSVRLGCVRAQCASHKPRQQSLRGFDLVEEAL